MLLYQALKDPIRGWEGFVCAFEKVEFAFDEVTEISSHLLLYPVYSFFIFDLRRCFSCYLDTMRSPEWLFF